MHVYFIFNDAATKFDNIEHYRFVHYFQRGRLIDDKWFVTRTKLNEHNAKKMLMHIEELFELTFGRRMD